MYSIAGKIFDINDDLHYKVAMANKTAVKGCQVPDSQELEKLSDKDFALIMKTASGKRVRKYPINNDNNIKLSSVYFNAVKKDLPDQIVKTAEAGFIKQANEIDLASVRTGNAVLSWRQYPINNEVNVKTAMERFPYTSQRMNPREKFAYARSIIKEASKYNLKPNEFVSWYGSDSINPVSVKVACSIRERHLSSAEDKELLHKLAESPHPEKFIEFDKLAGLSDYVADGKIPDGYATCYAMIKSAKVSDEERIKNIPLQTIEKLFDSEFAKSWAKEPYVIYKSLPMPAQIMIDKQASAIGGAMAATAGMLATERIGEGRGAKKVIDQQFDAKGWVPGKKCLYEKNEERIVRQDGDYVVTDKDGNVRLAANSLTKLVMMV